MPRRKERGGNMKAYITYETIAYKEIEIPDKFAELVTPGGEWNEEVENLWDELDDYTHSKEFRDLCRSLDGEICALEDENGFTLTEW